MPIWYNSFTELKCRTDDSVLHKNQEYNWKTKIIITI